MGNLITKCVEFADSLNVTTETVTAETTTTMTFTSSDGKRHGEASFPTNDARELYFWAISDLIKKVANK